MYNGNDFLSCIKIPATKQSVAKKSEKIEAMDFAADHRVLISTANKVFGEGKWNHTVVHQTLDYVEIIGAKCNVGCVSSVKVQLENGTFHEDVGYYSAEESTKGSSIHNARIGSAVNGLRRALLSFGDKIERELQPQKQINSQQIDDIQKSIVQRELQPQKQINSQQTDDIQKSIVQRELQPQKQINSEQTDDIQKSMHLQSANKQIEEKSNVPTQEPDVYKTVFVTTRNVQPDKNKVPLIKKVIDPNPPSPSSSSSSSRICPKELLLSLFDEKELHERMQNDKEDTKTKDKLKQGNISPSSAKEILRMERKRKQMEKQMEFKKRMMEKEELVLNNDNKPNPKY